MAYDPEEDRRSRQRANNAVGTFAGLMFLALMLMGALIAFLIMPAMPVTVPPPIPGHDEATEAE
jgi:hypothetical protein